MLELPWNEYNPDWRALSPEAPERTLWTPEQLEVYDTYTWRNAVRKTPAAFAAAVTPEWQDLPHIKFISDIIAAFVHNQLLAPNGKPARKLFLTMPPRHGKSFLLSQHVPAWYLSLFPNRQVILTTYEAEFAAKWGGLNRAILEQHGSKFGLGLKDDSKAKNRWGLARPHLGGMITAGKGGPITGEGGGLLIGDDWIKNAQEAASPVQRETDWNWYNTTFKTRGQKDLANPDAPPPKILLLMTRWHDDDVMGRLLARHGDDLVVIHLPALSLGPEIDPLKRPEGVALCPKIMTEDELLEFKKEDPPSFQALYQGDPTPDEGGLFSKSNFRFWRYARSYEDPDDPLTDAYILQTPEGAEIAVRARDCKHFITVDLAISEKKKADYSVFGLYALTPNRDLLLISQFRERIEEAEHLPRLQRFYDESKAALKGLKIHYVGIEKQTYGLSLIKNGRRNSNMPIWPLKADLDKFARAVPAGGYVKAGQFYLPVHVEWSEEFISECTSFPDGTHDDMVDTFSYAAFVCEGLFSGFRSKPRTDDILEDDEDNPHARNLKRIAERNARYRRQRKARGW